MRTTLKLHTILALVASLALAFSLATRAMAQEGPLTNASFNGTYVMVHLNSNPGGPMNNEAAVLIRSFDGDGSFRWFRVYRNRAGEVDGNGNFTRNIDVTTDDPGTWQYGIGTYDVHPSGAFFFTAGDDVSDGAIIRTEMIDGVLTVTEFVVFTRNANQRNGGGMNLFSGTRIADGDVLPTAPGD